MKILLVITLLFSAPIFSDSAASRDFLDKFLENAEKRNEELKQKRIEMLLNKQIEYSSDDIHLVCDTSYYFYPDLEKRNLLIIDKKLKGGLMYSFFYRKLMINVKPIDVREDTLAFYFHFLASDNPLDPFFGSINRTTLKFGSLQCEKVSINKFKKELTKFKNWIKERQDKRKI